MHVSVAALAARAAGGQLRRHAAVSLRRRAALNAAVDDLVQSVDISKVSAATADRDLAQLANSLAARFLADKGLARVAAAGSRHGDADDAIGSYEQLEEEHPLLALENQPLTDAETRGIVDSDLPALHGGDAASSIDTDMSLGAVAPSLAPLDELAARNDTLVAATSGISIIPPIEALPVDVRPALWQMLSAMPEPDHLPVHADAIRGVQSIYDVDVRSSNTLSVNLPKKYFQLTPEVLSLSPASRNTQRPLEFINPPPKRKFNRAKKLHKKRKS